MSWRVGTKLPIAIMAAVGLLGSAGPVQAQTPQSVNLKVSAIVGEACTVSAAELDFGAGYDGTAPVQGTGGIDVDCVGQTAFKVALNGGQDGNGQGQRRMKNASNAELLYTLYVDEPGGADTWDTGEVVGAPPDGGFFTGSQEVPVYGMISTGQINLDSGLYSDQVIITLHFF